MTKAYNEWVCPQGFQEGELVVRRAEAAGPTGKLDAKWDGPFRITEVIGAGTYRLEKLDGKQLPLTWNARNLRKYYT